LKRFKSISLLIVLSIIVFPWRTICVSSFAQEKEHHKVGELSPCQLHEIYKGSNIPVFFPPSNCNNLSANSDTYPAPEKFQLKPPFQLIALGAVFFKLIIFEHFDKVDYFLSPDPKCRSANLVSYNPLRGPPLFSLSSKTEIV
jgi:hypothetical protein